RDSNTGAWALDRYIAPSSLDAARIDLGDGFAIVSQQGTASPQRIRIYERDASGSPRWGEVAALTPSAGGAAGGIAAGDGFACAGFPGAAGGGRLCIFEKSGASWQETAAFSSPAGADASGFAQAVAQNGGTIAAADRFRTAAGETAFPNIYLYEKQGASWVHSGTIETPVDFEFEIWIDEMYPFTGDPEIVSLAMPSPDRVIADYWIPNDFVERTILYKKVDGAWELEAYIGFSFYAPQTLSADGDTLFAGSRRVELFDATATIAGASTPEISIGGEPEVFEPDSGTLQISFELNLSQAVSAETSVHYSLEHITTDDNDITPASGTVAIPSGSTRKNIIFSIRGDFLPEPDETFRVRLTGASRGQITVSEATGTILDDGDLPFDLPEISIGDAEISESDSGIRQIVFPLAFSDWTQDHLTISYAVEHITTDEGDVESGAGEIRVTSPALQRIIVNVNGDEDVEPDETFRVRITNITRGTLVDGEATGTILNNDEPPPQEPVLVADAYVFGQTVQFEAGPGKGAPGLLENDINIPQAAVTSYANHGSVSLSPDGSFSYRPNPNFIGTDVFYYAPAVSLPVERIAGQSHPWKFFHPTDGIPPAASEPAWDISWMLPSYLDDHWSDGSGLMGYGTISASTGNLPLTTDIGTPPAGMRYSAYFRTSFEAEPGNYRMSINLSRDDAAIVYLNGAEVGRSAEPGADDFLAAPDSWELSASSTATATDGAREGAIRFLPLEGVHELSGGPNTLAISSTTRSTTASPNRRTSACASKA
ncbi:MAG: Ig-like domain-containing protein, partial [Verrucomicrobiales bacterium]